MHLRAYLILDSNRKMANGKLKIKYKAQNITWTNPHIEKSLELRLTRPKT
jgi:hypothetical protein